MHIWTDFKPGTERAELLRAAATSRPGRHTLGFAAEGAGLDSADIAIGQPDPAAIIALLAAAPASPRLKWIHITSAGYTRFDRDDFWAAARSARVAVTNSSSVFAEPCAQHLLAFMLGFARALPYALANQLGPRAWHPPIMRQRSTILADQKAVLVGYGAIARRLAELLAPFRLDLVGVRRTPAGDESIRTVPLSALHAELSAADHVINILPLNPSTEHFFSAAQFAAMKPGALFYNIGRGKTVDQPALLSALASSHLAGAYLDVTDPEPLPPDHPLWTAPNCFITTHTGGMHTTEPARMLAHITENLARFESNAPLLDRVNRDA